MTSLLESHPSLTDPEDRRRSRLLGRFLFVLTLLFGCVDVSLNLAIAGYRTPWFGYVILATTFALNRAGYYRVAASLFVAMFPTVAFALVYLGKGVAYLSFSYLVIAPMVAAIFLPIWGVAVTTLVNLCGIALAPVFAPPAAAAVQGVPLLGSLSSNAMVGVMAMLYMHHRNALEADRRRALVQSEERLRLSLEQLREAQKMEALGRMSGGIAHDFNNVLTVILGSVAQLRRRAPAPELDDIDNAAHSAASLTRKLLAFSRGAVLAPRVLDLDEVVGGAIDLIGRLIGEDIAIRYRAEPVRWLTRIDGSQLEQVLLNLAANARDAMPDGGVLGIELSNVSVSAAQLAQHPEAEAGDYVRLRVSDTGRGMDEETRRRMFEPFFTTKERGKGTGLGLAMVFGTVSQSGGFIETQSTPGQGTRFDLYFPRAAEREARARKPTPLPPSGNETLLLVEDDPAVRKVIGLVLADAGYAVVQAPSVTEARSLYAARKHEIDLVITDEVMPGGRGSDLVAELRRERPELPALCMTGYIEPRTAAGPTLLDLPTLQKPFDSEVLLRRVRDLIDARGASARARVQEQEL